MVLREGVILRTLRFPELSTTRSFVTPVEAIACPHTRDYDVILGTDVLTPVVMSILVHKLYVGETCQSLGVLMTHCLSRDIYKPGRIRRIDLHLQQSFNLLRHNLELVKYWLPSMIRSMPTLLHNSKPICHRGSGISWQKYCNDIRFCLVAS